MNSQRNYKDQLILFKWNRTFSMRYILSKKISSHKNQKLVNLKD